MKEEQWEARLSRRVEVVAGGIECQAKGLAFSVWVGERRDQTWLLGNSLWPLSSNQIGGGEPAGREPR